MSPKFREYLENSVRDALPGRPGVPSCRCCAKEMNTLHLLGCHYVRSHYDMVSTEDCDAATND